jgi:DNA-binding beta-propeller fold protein YncE
LYVTDFSNDYIQVFNRDGEFLRTIGSSGSEPGQFLGPSGITVSPTSGNIFVSDQINNRVQVLNPEGEAILVFGQSGSEPGQFNQPIGLEVDEFENIYVSDSQNNRVQVFDKNGNFLSSYGTSVANPGPSSILAPGQPLPEPGVFNWTAGAHYNDGKLYVGDFFNSRVLQLDVKRTAVPEPTSALGLGLLGLSAAVHLRKKKHHKVAILGRSAIFLSCSTAKE